MRCIKYVFYLLRFLEPAYFVLLICPTTVELVPVKQSTDLVFAFALYFNRFRRAFFLFLREPCGRSEPDQIITSPRNVSYKAGQHKVKIAPSYILAVITTK